MDQAKTQGSGNEFRLLSSDPGAVAQLGERLLCKQEVTGSIPVGSTRADQTSSRRRLHQEQASGIGASVGKGPG